ncbi:MAG: PEGA domain-containing protein [Akkermansia sp.]|nr:PEGA domain-containing protein [Akkermansia sp.]
MKTGRIFLFTAVVSGLVSCYGTKDFTIRTSPEGARIAINGKDVGASPITVEIEQDKNLGIVAYKPGYTVASETVPTQTSTILSWIWTKDSPYAKYIEEDEILLPMRKIATVENYRPTTLEPYTGGGGRTAPGRTDRGNSSAAPPLRDMPTLD